MFNYRTRIDDPNFITLPERLVDRMKLGPGVRLDIQYKQKGPGKTKYHVEWTETVDRQNRVKICTAVWIKRQSLDGRKIKISVLDKHTVLVRPAWF